MRASGESSLDISSNSDCSSNMDIIQWMNDISKTQLQRNDLNHMIMNYLVVEGFKDAAEQFATEAELHPAADMVFVEERLNILKAIKEGNVEEAMRKATTLHPEIMDDNVQLYFHLQQLVLIELIRAEKVEDAVIYAQKHFAEKGKRDTSCLQQLERTLALLAFETPNASPFADLLHPAHRQKVGMELNTALLRAQNHERTSPDIMEMLKLLLWSQDHMGKKNGKYPVMTDLCKGTIQISK